MALTQDRSTPNRGGSELSLPVAANTLIHAGAMVAVNGLSLATPGATSTTLRGIGVAIERADNTGGAAGAVNVRIRRGVWRYKNSAAGDLVALKDIGKNCYMVDDETLALTDGGASRSIAGIIHDVDAAGVWVEF